MEDRIILLWFLLWKSINIFNSGCAMFEIRQDYLTQAMVFMSEERSLRPNFFYGRKNEAAPVIECPFCPENGDVLTDIVSREYGGRIIILKNKYPVTDSAKAGMSEAGIQSGIHEVMVDTDIHSQAFISFSQEEMELSLKSIIRRAGELSEYDNIKYVQAFKNDGRISGASIGHSHWQILAMPFIPQKQSVIHSNFEKYYSENGKSYIEYLYEQKDLIICENSGAFAYMPYSSSYEYNINIAPVRHVSSITDLTEKEIFALANVLKPALSALEERLGEFSFNICFQNAPTGDYKASHFYMEIIPRLGNFAGLELSTQTFVNSKLPEKHAPLFAQLIKEKFL